MLTSCQFLNDTFNAAKHKVCADTKVSVIFSDGEMYWSQRMMRAEGKIKGMKWIKTIPLPQSLSEDIHRFLCRDVNDKTALCVSYFFEQALCAEILLERLRILQIITRSARRKHSSPSTYQGLYEFHASRGSFI